MNNIFSRKALKSIIFTTGMLFICSQGHAQLAWQNQINELVSQSLPTAEIGIMVMDADSGKTLYEYNAYKAFMPASTMKLFSAAAALDYLTESASITIIPISA